MKYSEKIAFWNRIEGGEILIVGIHPYFLEKGGVWFEKLFDIISPLMI